MAEDQGEPGQGDYGQDPSILMDEIVENLKMLNYEQGFLNQKGFKPLSRAQFVIPGGNPSEQFIYFNSLVSWLFQLNGSSASFSKYDDPSTVANNITVEIRKLGIDLDFAPGKLKSGHGEGPCLVLQALSKRALESRRVTFHRPVFPDEGGDLEGEIIEGDEEPDIIDEAIQSAEDDDDVFAEMQGVNQKQVAVEDEKVKADIAPIWSQIDSKDWELECERVAGRLRIAGDPTGGDNREWRAHLEQTRVHMGNVKKGLPEVEAKLRKIADELSKGLERITQQEKKINQSMGEITGDYRSQTNALNSMNTRYRQLNEHVAELSSTLNNINEKIEGIQDKIENQGKAVTDSSPLQAIKEAIKMMRIEGKEMELRCAVLSHSVFQAKLKEKSRNDS